MMEKKIRVCVVDGDEPFRLLLTALIADWPCAELATIHSDGGQALSEISAAEPDVVVTDLAFTGMDGTSFIQALSRICPEVRILVLTEFCDAAHVFEALRAGAGGYILKSSTGSEILQSIKKIHQGGAPMCDTIARMVVDSFSIAARETRKVRSGLTAREETVLRLLAKGHLAKEVADTLGISFNTARFYMRQIYSKLHVRSKTEAVLKYIGD